MAAQPPSAWTFTANARSNILKAREDFTAAATFKMMLLGALSNIGGASTVYSALTAEIGGAHGYTTGGQAITLGLSGTNPTIIYLPTPALWTADASGITAYFAAIYAATTGDVICWCLLDSTPQPVTVVSNPLSVANGLANPIGTLA